MCPSVIITVAESRGVEIVPTDGDGLILRGTATARAELRPLIAAHKMRLVAHLTAPPCPSCKRRTDENRICWKCQNRPCRACGKLTGSALLSLCNQCPDEGET